MFVKVNGKHCFIIDEDYNYSSIELHKKYDLLLKCYMCSTYFVINPPCGPALYLLCNKTSLWPCSISFIYNHPWSISIDFSIFRNLPCFVIISSFFKILHSNKKTQTQNSFQNILLCYDFNWYHFDCKFSIIWNISFSLLRWLIFFVISLAGIKIKPHTHNKHWLLSDMWQAYGFYTLFSSTNKTDINDLTVILLKVMFTTNNPALLSMIIDKQT